MICRKRINRDASARSLVPNAVVRKPSAKDLLRRHDFRLDEVAERDFAGHADLVRLNQCSNGLPS